MEFCLELFQSHSGRCGEQNNSCSRQESNLGRLTRKSVSILMELLKKYSYQTRAPKYLVVMAVHVTLHALLISAEDGGEC